MIFGGRTFSEQGYVSNDVGAALDSEFAEELAAHRAQIMPAAEWYVSGPDDAGRYSLRADNGLQGHELGASDATGLPRLQELVRLHNGHAVGICSDDSHDVPCPAVVS